MKTSAKLPEYCPRCGFKSGSHAPWCPAGSSDQPAPAQTNRFEQELNEAKADNERLRQVKESYQQRAISFSDELATLRQQLTAVEKERDEAQVRYAAFQLHTDTTVRQLESELAELRQDRERLDWLEANGNLPLMYRTSVGLSERSTKDAWYWDYRAAIDAARQQEGRG